jgi:hypothetical protein
MMGNITALVDMRARRGGITMDRYLELLFSAAFCYLLEGHDRRQPFSNDVVAFLCSCLQAMTSAWELLSGFNTRHDSLSPMAKLYSYAKEIITLPGVIRVRQADDSGVEIAEEDLRCEIMQRVNVMRQIMQDAKFEPMVWGIRKQLLPAPLLLQLRVWPLAIIVSSSTPPVRLEAEAGSGPEASPLSELNEMTEELYGAPTIARIGEEVCIPRFDDVNHEALSWGATEERLFI